jgi:uncharacterized OB-fold protein
MSGRDTDFRQRFDVFRAQGELRYPRCPVCKTTLRFTQRLCPAHPEAEPEFIPASGRATIHTVIEYPMTYNKDMPAPYCVGLVELEEGPRLLALMMLDGKVSGVAGRPVRVSFDESRRLVAHPADSGDAAT